MSLPIYDFDYSSGDNSEFSPCLAYPADGALLDGCPVAIRVLPVLLAEQQL